MAPRYFIEIARRPCPEPCRGPQITPSDGLLLVQDAPGLRIYANEEMPLIRLPNDSGVILGHVFSRQRPYCAIDGFDDRPAERIRLTYGTSLLKEVWGGYLAVITNTRDGGPTLLRDPSGAMPCLLRDLGHSLLVASDIDAICCAGLPVPDVDWSYVPRLLYAPDLRTTKTGLTGITELLAGFSAHCSATGTDVTQEWTPWDYCAPEANQTSEALAANLYQIISECVGAWAGRFRHVLHSVSGGLDSSVIAAALKASKHTASYITLATDEPEGDERGYARTLTDALHVTLIEAFHRLDYIDIDHASAAHLPRPILYPISQSDRYIKARLARDTGIDGFFTGIGGDNVFCHMQSASPLVDRFKAEGMSPGLWRTLNDICTLTDCTWLDALFMALKRMQSGPRYQWRGNDRLLDPRAVAAFRDTLDHPWLHAPADALPGKAAHVAKLVRIQGTIDGFPRDMPLQVNPLLSQPIVEACLRIPTWKWISDGRNRSVVRQAFTGRLPDALLNRRTKGGPDSFATSILLTHRQHIGDRLLGGRLAANDIVDRDALAHLFDASAPPSTQDDLRTAALIEAEAWCRYWEDRKRNTSEAG